MQTLVPIVSQTQIAAYLEGTARGTDISTCLIDSDYNLVPQEIWLWDGTTEQHHPATDDGLALLFPDATDRTRFINRLVRVVLDYAVIVDYCNDLTDFRQAA